MNINQVLHEVNELKKTTENKITLYTLTLTVTSLLIIFLILGTNVYPKPFFVILVISISIALIIYLDYQLIKKYQMSFKNTLIPLALKEIGDNITYQTEGVSKETAEITGMFGMFTIFKSEDTVSGSLNGVSFTSSDVRLGYMVSTGKSATYVPVCHGQLYIFDFNKHFKTKTIIREKNILKLTGLKRIKLESEAFNKKFKVFSENELDTFYLLTPHFMEKLLELEQKHQGDLFIAFYQNQLHLGIHNNKDRFKVPLFTEIDETTFKNQLDDLLLIKAIINELKLDDKYFI